MRAATSAGVTQTLRVTPATEPGIHGTDRQEARDDEIRDQELQLRRSSTGIFPCPSQFTAMNQLTTQVVAVIEELRTCLPFVRFSAKPLFAKSTSGRSIDSLRNQRNEPINEFRSVFWSADALTVSMKLSTSATDSGGRGARSNSASTAITSVMSRVSSAGSKNEALYRSIATRSLSFSLGLTATRARNDSANLTRMHRL